MRKRAFISGGVLICVLLIACIAHFGESIFSLLEHSHEATVLTNFFVIATLFVLSFVVFYLSHLVRIPSFVVAIALGVIAKPLLVPIVGSKEALEVIVGLSATLILFSGGLEIPFRSFKKLLTKICAISFGGLFITAFLFSWALWFLSGIFGYELSIVVCVLLGAVLASTDPAAIIPVLNKLRFHNRAVKDIIISESAVTDVVGTLLTVVFLSLIGAGVHIDSINEWYASVFGASSVIILIKQLFFGTLFGFLGYYALELLLKVKRHYGQEFESDAAFFISVPIIIFTVALFTGGSGYLAAFVAGLVFHNTEHLLETERFFNNLVDGFLKPIIFILLGALVDIPQLIQFAPIGIGIALVFIFVIRPIAVFASLGAFHHFGKEKLSVQDLLFISFVRETGAIPAVLMLTIVALDLSGMNGLVEIGMWVILLSLIIEPIFTPHVAKKLHIAEAMQDVNNAKLDEHSSALLVTRGETFVDRFPKVFKWARLHSVEEVVVMLCLEDDYSIEREENIRKVAEDLFQKAQNESEDKGYGHMKFRFISRQGSLHENINAIAKIEHKVNVIFVGKKMLDYRLDEIKRLQLPFYFID